MNKFDMKLISKTKKRIKKLLYVWDGSTHVDQTVQKYFDSFKNVSIKSIYVLPHESIYDYNTVCSSVEDDLPSLRRIHNSYKRFANSDERLKTAKFEVHFGDRIATVVRLSKMLRTSTIIMPRFKQSGFSKWIHGDLNTRIKREAACEVVFYESSN